MAGPPNDGCFQITQFFDGPSLPTGACITIGVGNGSKTLDEIADDFDTYLRSLLLGNMTTSTSLSHILVKQGPVATGPSYEKVQNAAGTFNEETCAPNTAVLYTKQPTFVSRKFAGRFYVPGVPENQVNDAGILETTYFAACQGAANDFMDDLDLAGYQPLIFPADSGSPREFNSLAVSAVVATQRRRLRR